jgi:hypothetical protein
MLYYNKATMRFAKEDNYHGRAGYYAMAKVSPDCYFSITSPNHPLTWDDLVDNEGEMCADTGVSQPVSEIVDMEDKEGGVAGNDGPLDDNMEEEEGGKEDNSHPDSGDDRKPAANISFLSHDDGKPPAEEDPGNEEDNSHPDSEESEAPRQLEGSPL